MVGRAGPDTSAAGIVLSPVQAGDGAITVADAHLLFTAEFSRVGDDLLLTGNNGTAQIISGYFTLEVPPPLFSPDGAMMSADLIEMLVGPRAPDLQYAQAGGAPVAEAIGQIETLTGNAQVIRAGAAVDLAVGDSVFQGDIVQTGAGSTLGITFIDETVFSLSGDARMALTSMVFDPGGSANSMLFDLVQGTFVFVTGQVAPTGDMRIETPVATIGVRGTVPITKISAIDGNTLFSIGEDPGGGVGAYQLFDKLSGASLTTISDLSQLVRIQTAGGPFFESVKTPGELAIDQALVSRAHDIYGQAQQRLGEEQRGDIEDGEFEQASDEANAGADTDPFAAPPIETAAPPITGPVTSGGLGVDEPEFGEERRTDTNISSSQTQVTQTTSPPPSSSQTSTPPPRQAPVEPNSPPGESNNPPIANADTATTDGSTPVVIAVLGNDSDPEGNALSIVSVTQGGNGSVANNPDGTLTYTPSPGFVGTDSFTYTVSDGVGGFATTSVNVDVGSGNRSPVAGDDEGTTAEDASVTVSVLDNDSDPDGDTLSVSAVTQGANGSASINPDGTITYTPNANFNGADSFTYTISDGQGGSDTATVDVTVNPRNDPPAVDLNGASGASFTEGGAPVVVDDNLLVSDPDNTTLTGATVSIDAVANPGLEVLAATTAGTNIAASFDLQTGVLTLSGTDTLANYQQVLRSVTYENLSRDPTTGGTSAQRNIRFAVNDGAATSAAVIAAIALVAQNDAPILDTPTSLTTASGFNADVTDTSGNAIAVADPDAPSVLVTLSVDNGTLSLGQISGLTFQTGDGSGDASMSFSATLADVNAALNSLTYQADRGFIGKDTLSITVDDQGGTGYPGPLSDSGSVDIVVSDRSGDVLFSNGTLIVGDTGVGNFAVVGGRSFSAFEMIVGNLGTGDGSVLIDGPGSTTGQFSEMLLSGTNQNGAGPSAIIGAEGRGELRVLGGADLRIDGQQGGRPEFQVGQLAGSDGTVTVSGVGSSIVVVSAGGSGYIAVGRSGTGRLEILDGAMVRNAAEGRTVIGGDLASQAAAGVGTVLVGGSSPNAVSTLDAGAQLVIGMEIDANGQPIAGAASGTGTLTIGEYGAVNVFEAYIGQNGRVEGTGNFNAGEVFLDGGTIAPGFSPGTLRLAGNFTLTAGTLETELGGTVAGQSDLIDVTGQADVQGGLVDFTLVGGYLPAVGDTVAFLTAGDGLVGATVNLSSAVHGVTADFDFQLDFNAGAASFTALSTAQAGTSTIFHGGALDDVYAGGDGDDVLRGGAGADTLTGGAGRDLFVLAPGDGGFRLAAADVLSDFEDGVDRIGLAGGLQFSDLSIGAAGAGGSAISVTQTGEVLALVEGVAPSLLDTNDFTIVM